MFSIIIPAYNAEKYLSITLESLINQTYQNFEVILINDGSTDSTQEIIEDYCQKFSNFKFLSQENQGVATARNNGMEIAKGEYIAFLDSDGDTYTKRALEHYHDTIINNKMPDLVIGRQTMVDPWSTHAYANAKRLSNSKIIAPHNKWMIWTMSLLNKVFSRKKLIETGLKMSLFSYASDGAFVLPFAYSCDNIVGCPHRVIIYNKRMFFDGYSISQTSSMKTLNDYLEVHDVILNKFLEYSESYRKKYSNDKFKLALFEEDYLIYLDALLHRQVFILLSQFYRFFWRTDIEVLEKVKKTILSYKEDMFPTSWEKLKKKQ
ncbi:Glycosyltransferase AglE [Candidatus Methanobinarius endosymbioticus]|uniref:Glycosyltransferase AglE n=1 Tax=Candidatus Methanobinarius endosymbioticus TaxID=2006182 RepID=A0A366M8V2_9EURY|nr:Glycosyltransferase AglE [Candidatus Methanobinarius endosymbioticus]